MKLHINRFFAKTSALIMTLVLSVQGFGQSDDPCGAPALPVNTSCSFATYTNAGATATVGVPAPGCASYSGGDVWFTVTVPANGNLTIDTGTGVMTDGGMALYSGTCGSLTLIECDDDDSANGLMPFISRTGLTPGATIWIRMWEFGNNNNGTFSICAFSPVPASNDECATALPVTVNPDFMCGSTTAGTVLNATASPQNAASCGGTENDDVWFSFVATSTTHTIDLLNVAGSTTDLYHSVWSGTCPTLTLVPGTCSDPNSSTVTGLTIGTTYFLRVYTWSSAAGATSTFNVCIGTPPPPPANDNCAGAYPVTVNSGTQCGSTTAGTVASATPSPQNPASCAGDENDDVWFSFVATSTTHTIALLNVAGSTTDLYHSVWQGTCPTLTLVPGTCSDPNSSNLTGLTIGTTYFIRVNTWGSSAGATSYFDLCVGTPGPPPTNISCAIPDPICSGSPITFTAQANNTQADEVDPGNDYDCLFSQPNPSWYYLEIATGGNLVIDITAGSDVDYAIWGPFTDLTNAVANCNSYAVPEDCSFSASPIEQAVVNGVTAGQVYVLLVTNYANTVQTITVTDAPSNTATTDCTIVPLSVELTDFNGVNVDNEIVLSWTTASEQNNSHFVVERSVDASVWTAIAVENGAGTTTSMQQYTSLDRNPSNGDNYYRLKQFDYDGKMSISDIISVSSSSVNKVIVYPNPSNDRISVISNHEIISISIVDIRGTVVYSGNFDKVNSTTIELSDLNSGLYYLQTQTTSGTMTERIVVQH